MMPQDAISELNLSEENNEETSQPDYNKPEPDQDGTLESKVEHLKWTISNLSKPTIDVESLIFKFIMPFTDIAETYIYLTVYQKVDILGGDRGRRLAHLTIYGCPKVYEDPITHETRKFRLEDIDLNSKKFYPNRLPLDSSLMEDIGNMVNSFKNSCIALANQMGSLALQLADLGVEVGMSAADVANKMATMPPQPASVAYAIFDFNNKVLNLSTALSPLIPGLDGLRFIKFIIIPEKIKQIEDLIGSIIVSIDVTLTSISKVKLG